MATNNKITSLPENETSNIFFLGHVLSACCLASLTLTKVGRSLTELVDVMTNVVDQGFPLHAGSSERVLHHMHVRGWLAVRHSREGGSTTQQQQQCFIYLYIEGCDLAAGGKMQLHHRSGRKDGFSRCLSVGRLRTPDFNGRSSSSGGAGGAGSDDDAGSSSSSGCFERAIPRAIANAAAAATTFASASASARLSHTHTHVRTYVHEHTVSTA